MVRPLKVGWVSNIASLFGFVLFNVFLSIDDTTADLEVGRAFAKRTPAFQGAV